MQLTGKYREETVLDSNLDDDFQTQKVLSLKKILYFKKYTTIIMVFLQEMSKDMDNDEPFVYRLNDNGTGPSLLVKVKNSDF